MRHWKSELTRKYIGLIFHSTSLVNKNFCRSFLQSLLLTNPILKAISLPSCTGMFLLKRGGRIVEASGQMIQVLLASR